MSGVIEGAGHGWAEAERADVGGAGIAAAGVAVGAAAKMIGGTARHAEAVGRGLLAGVLSVALHAGLLALPAGREGALRVGESGPLVVQLVARRSASIPADVPLPEPPPEPTAETPIEPLAEPPAEPTAEPTDRPQRAPSVETVAPALANDPSAHAVPVVPSRRPRWTALVEPPVPALPSPVPRPVSTPPAEVPLPTPAPTPAESPAESPAVPPVGRRDGDAQGSAAVDRPAQALGDGINAPPRYPALAVRRGWEGVVWLTVEVLPSGAVASVELLRSSGRDILDRAALDAVARWTFAAALRAGEPVRCCTRQRVRFQLEQ